MRTTIVEVRCRVIQVRRGGAFCERGFIPRAFDFASQAAQRATPECPRSPFTGYLPVSGNRQQKGGRGAVLYGMRDDAEGHRIEALAQPGQR